MSRLVASTVLRASLLFLAACGGGDATSPSGSSGQHKSIAVSLGQSSVAVPMGSSGTVGVTVTRGGGFSGNVSFHVEGMPSGVTISFSPDPVPGAVATTTMTIAVASTATTGRYLMTIQAQGSGVDEGGSAQIWLDIQSPPDYSLRTAKDTVSVVQGAAGQVDVNVTRVNGFAGDVALSLEGAPTGVTGTFAPNPATAERSTLSLAVGAAVATGKYTVTVKGAATGLTAHSTTFVLDVVAGSVPGFTLTLNPTALTVVSGGSSGSITALLHRTGGFTGGVNLTVQGQPTGVTVTGPTSPVTDTAATLSFTAGLALTGGTYPVTITAKATGYPDRQATLQLTVQEAPGFWLTLSPSTINTANGAAPQTVIITIARLGGFADTVRLSMTGLPTGMTTTFNPAATLGNATMTVAAVNVAPGTYAGTLRATATGQVDRVATLTVNVSAAATDVVWRFCTPNPAPVFFALQDGASPFAVVAAAPDGSYVSSIASGKGAVAFVLPGLPDTASNAVVPVASLAPRRVSRGLASGYTTYMYYGTVADLQAVAATLCPGGHKTVRGSVAGVPASDAWTVALDGVSAMGLPGTGNSFTLSNVLTGARDLVAARALPGSTQTLADAFVLRRDVDAADGSTLPVIDFTAAEAFAPGAGTLTVNGIPGGAVTEAVLGFLTSNGTSATIGQLDSVSSAARAVPGIPTAKLRAGDLHTIQSSSETPGYTLAATLYVHQVAAWNISLPSPPVAPTVDVYATSPYIRMRTRGTLGTQGGAFGGMVRATFIQPTAQRATVISDSRNFIGSTSSFELRTGGYNTLAGWSEANYGFQAGALVRSTVEVLTPGYAFTPADGNVLFTLRMQSSVTP